MKNKLLYINDNEFQEALNTSSSLYSLLKKLNLSTNGTSYALLKKEIEKRNLDTKMFDELKKLNKRKNKYSPEEVFIKNSPVENIRIYLKRFKLKNINECEICGTSQWLGKPLPIQIHHKDGDHYNNELDNLQALCPNCHSLTENFGSKNEKKKTNFKKKNNKKCIDCEKEVYGDNIRCANCNLKWLQMQKRLPKKKELNIPSNMLLSVKELSCKYSVNEEQIINQIKKYDLWEKFLFFQNLSEKEKEEKRNAISKNFNPTRIDKFTSEEKNNLRKELKQKIRTKTFLEIGKDYGLTDNAIRKWCKKLDLPYKKTIIKKISDEDWDNI